LFSRFKLWKKNGDLKSGLFKKAICKENWGDNRRGFGRGATKKKLGGVL